MAMLLDLPPEVLPKTLDLSGLGKIIFEYIPQRSEQFVQPAKIASDVYQTPQDPVGSSDIVYFENKAPRI